MLSLKLRFELLDRGRGLRRQGLDARFEIAPFALDLLKRFVLLRQLLFKLRGLGGTSLSQCLDTGFEIRADLPDGGQFQLLSSQLRLPLLLLEREREDPLLLRGELLGIRQLAIRESLLESGKVGLRGIDLLLLCRKLRFDLPRRLELSLKLLPVLLGLRGGISQPGRGFPLHRRHLLAHGRQFGMGRVDLLLLRGKLHLSLCRCIGLNRGHLHAQGRQFGMGRVDLLLLRGKLGFNLARRLELRLKLLPVLFRLRGGISQPGAGVRLGRGHLLAQGCQFGMGRVDLLLLRRELGFNLARRLGHLAGHRVELRLKLLAALLRQREIHALRG